MFKPTDRQRSILEAEYQLSESVRRRLKNTWANGFAAKVLPILMEEEVHFASLYSDETGRPNWSVARLLGLSLLQEYNNFDDQKALDCLSFDVRWQHALGLRPEDSYLSRRSLVDFRSRLVSADPEMRMMRDIFDKVGSAAIKELSISVKEQRVDSTLVTSNILTRGRVDLFRKTLVHFLDWLSQRLPQRMERFSPSTRKWYEGLKDDGWFAKYDKDKVKPLLAELADRLYEVVRLFAQDKEVRIAEPYQLVERIIGEHCKLVSATDDDDEKTSDDGDKGADTSDGDAPVKIKVLKKPEYPGNSMQSPYDPDAGYGHKGPGYMVHVPETCHNESTEIITDFDVTSAGETDRGKDIGVIDRLIESDKQPEILYEDAGYPTAQGLIDAEKKGTKLMAPITAGRLPEGTIGRDRFQFDDASRLCTQCPAGHLPIRHGMRSTNSNKPATLNAYFDGKICRLCELQSKCIVRKPNNGKKGNPHLEVGAHLIARDKALAAQRENGWWDKYSIRAGVEASMSELKRGHGIGKLRIRRMPRVRFAVGMKIIACNIKRWLRVCARAEQAAEQARKAASAPFLALSMLLNRIRTASRRFRGLTTNFAA